MLKVKPFILGMATYLPGASHFSVKGSGGTGSGSYCYSVWMRHLVMAYKNGLNARPAVVAELGPGDSLGMGLAALLSGAETYLALDVVEFANAETNLRVFEELLALFRARPPIPGPDQFPKAKPALEDYAFPGYLLNEETMRQALDDTRVDRIRQALKDTRMPGSPVRYKAPWHDGTVLEESSVDMIFSQAVLEHVDELPGTYHAMKQWLKPGGFMSHQIDFKCHHTANEWNGHWRYGDFAWKLIRGNRPYLINRETYSTHKRLLAAEGCPVVYEQPVITPSKFSRQQLAARYQDMPEEDLTISGVFLQALKEA